MIITCNLHRGKAPEMVFGQGMEKDRTTYQVLTCPKCFRTVRVTPAMEQQLKRIEEMEQSIQIPVEKPKKKAR